MAACRNNRAAAECNIEILKAVIDACPADKFYRLRVYINDTYFLNDEMIAILTYAKNYITSTEKIDVIYQNYMSSYSRLYDQYQTKINDPDYQKLFDDMREIYTRSVQRISYEDNI